MYVNIKKKIKKNLINNLFLCFFSHLLLKKIFIYCCNFNFINIWHILIYSQQ